MSGSCPGGFNAAPVIPAWSLRSHKSHGGCLAIRSGGPVGRAEKLEALGEDRKEERPDVGVWLW